MTIQDFRFNSLSDQIINALISASQAFTEADTLLNEYAENKTPIKHMLLAFDVFYCLHSTQPIIDDIYRSLFIPDKTSTIGKTIETYTACADYANEKVKATEVLTAGDLLLINETISTDNIEPFKTKNLPFDLQPYVESVWPILHDLYGPQRQYPLLLETAVAC
jgi:hypothetical protein